MKGDNMLDVHVYGEDAFVIPRSKLDDFIRKLKESNNCWLYSANSEYGIIISIIEE